MNKEQTTAKVSAVEVQRVRIQLTVNDKSKRVEVDPRIPLVQLLRDDFGLTGTHVGCLTGHCGACTVMLNGHAVKSCTVLAASTDGDEVGTVEGLADGKLHPIQRAFWDEYGFQCGYCTAGMMLAGLELLSERPDPSDDEIRAGIAGNLCRCTGYENIVNSIRTAAALLRRGTSAT